MLLFIFSLPGLHLLTYLQLLSSSTEGQHHSSFIFTVYSQRQSQRYSYFIVYQPSLHISKTTNIEFRDSRQYLRSSPPSEHVDTRALAEQRATSIMPTMPTVARLNNLTHFDNNTPHKTSPFYNANTGSPAFMYFSIMAQFILLTFAGVFLLGFLLCFIRYRLRLFRRVKVIVRIWARDIAWKIRDRFLGRDSWPWTRQSSRHGLPPNRRRGAGSV